MKILVFGAGVLGSLYAGRLAAAGQDITLLARGERMEQIQRHGLVVVDESTGREATCEVKVVEELGAHDAYDLVIVIVRAEQTLDVVPAIAGNRCTPSVLFLQNNALGPATLIAALGRERVLLGFPGASGFREGARIRYRLIREQKTTVGELDGRYSPRLREIASAFRSAGFPVAINRRMDAWLKTHAVFVTAIAGAIYAAGGNCVALAAQPDGVPSLVRAIRQGFCSLRAMGVAIEPFKMAILFLRLPLMIPVAYWRRCLRRPEAELFFALHAQAAPQEMLVLINQLRPLMRSSNGASPDMDRLWDAVEKRASSVKPSY